MLKKINAILALITAVLVLIHTVTMGLKLFGVVEPSPVFTVFGKALMTSFCLHVILSLAIMFLSGGKGLKYPKLSKSIVEQRVSAILLLIFIHFHMKNYYVNNQAVAPNIFGFVTEILFITILMSHFMASVDKVLTTLGFCNKINITTIKIIALIAYVFSLAAVSYYFLGGMI